HCKVNKFNHKIPCRPQIGPASALARHGARLPPPPCTIQWREVHYRCAMTTATSPDTILQFNDVVLRYGDFTVLRDLSIQARKGQVVALMGGSGSGKTTLLRAATGQIFAQRGQVSVFGQDIAAVPSETLRQLRQRMGVLFQQGALFTDLNVFENVAFP